MGENPDEQQIPQQQVIEASTAEDSESAGRIAKWIARSGLCSRREAERWIEQGRVSINGKTIDSAANVVTVRDEILVDGNPLPQASRVRVWKMHKPIDTIVSDFDPYGRKLLKDLLPADMPRVNPVGRLDINSEGLILFTTDGKLKRSLELPDTGIPRTYKVRVYGTLNKKSLAALEKGIVIDGIAYGAIKVEISEQTSANSWITMTLFEGKNREVRRVCEHLGLQVNRLIRTAYGKVKLGSMPKGGLEELGQKEIYEAFGIGTKPKSTWAKAKKKDVKPRAKPWQKAAAAAKKAEKAEGSKAVNVKLSSPRLGNKDSADFKRR